MSKKIKDNYNFQSEEEALDYIENEMSRDELADILNEMRYDKDYYSSIFGECFMEPKALIDEIWNESKKEFDGFKFLSSFYNTNIKLEELIGKYLKNSFDDDELGFLADTHRGTALYITNIEKLKRYEGHNIADYLVNG